MGNYKNKIYARLDKNNIVTKMFSSVFEQPLETDILVEEGNEYYHAHVHLKYTVRDESDNFNYKYENDKIVELTDEEKEILFPKQEIQTKENLTDKLILDNINMQLQIDALITSQLGGIQRVR